MKDETFEFFFLNLEIVKKFFQIQNIFYSIFYSIFY